MQIAAKEATIKTAQIEIKALTVAGKQVTLAVFRQLDRFSYANWETCETRGTAWGRVNYHPDKSCLKDSSHHHIIWQSGPFLYRDKISNADWIKYLDFKVTDERKSELEQFQRSLLNEIARMDLLFIAV